MNDLCNQALIDLGEDDSVEDQLHVQRIDLLLQHYYEQQPAGYVINAPEVDPNPYLSPYAEPSASNDTSQGYSTPVSAGASRPFENYGGFPDPLIATGASTSGSTSPRDSQLNNPNMPELDRTPHTENTGCNLAQPEIQPPSPAPLLRMVAPAPVAELACDVCGKVLRGKEIWLDSNMQRHKREKHSLVAVLFTCNTCGKGFSRKHNLKVHVRTVHKDLSDQVEGVDA